MARFQKRVPEFSQVYVFCIYYRLVDSKFDKFLGFSNCMTIKVEDSLVFFGDDVLGSREIKSFCMRKFNKLNLLTLK